MRITPFGEKNFHLNTLLAISMAECLVANKILYCIIVLFIRFGLRAKQRPIKIECVNICRKVNNYM